MNLTILSRIFHPQQYSTGQSLTELSEILSEKGVNITVFAGQPVSFDRKEKFPRFMEYKGIKIFRVWGTRFSKNSIIGRVINDLTYLLSLFLNLIFRRIKEPLLVLTNPPILGLIATIVKKVKRVDFIYLIFDVYPDTAVNLGVIKKDSFFEKVWEFLNKLTYKNSKAVVVIGRDMRRIIERKFDKFKLNKDKITYIPIWTDDKRFLNVKVKKEENPLVKKLNLKDNFIVLYSGNMGRFHDIETIMEAVKRISSINREIKFVFIGEGYKKRYAMEFVNKNRLKNCIFLPFLPRKEFPLALAMADVALVSLLPGQEGLSVPSKTFSYWAVGIPVAAVMTPTSEIASIIKEYKSGEIIAQGEFDSLVNFILKLYNNKQLKDKMREEGKRLIKEKYNLEKVANEYIKLIK